MQGPNSYIGNPERVDWPDVQAGIKNASDILRADIMNDAAQLVSETMNVKIPNFRLSPNGYNDATVAP